MNCYKSLRNLNKMKPGITSSHSSCCVGVNNGDMRCIRHSETSKVMLLLFCSFAMQQLFSVSEASLKSAAGLARVFCHLAAVVLRVANQPASICFFYVEITLFKVVASEAADCSDLLLLWNSTQCREWSLAVQFYCFRAVDLRCPMSLYPAFARSLYYCHHHTLPCNLLCL